VGCPCMQHQGQASSSHSPCRPFLWGIHTELVTMASGYERVAPLGHPHRVSEDGKWVQEGCFSDCGKYACKHSQLSFSPCSQWAVWGQSVILPISLHSSSRSQVSNGGLSNSRIDSRQDPHKVPSNSKNNPQTPF
jgi:hypothetical protein